MAKKTKRKGSPTSAGKRKSNPTDSADNTGSDPNLGVEARKYEFPVASRDYIRSVLHDAGSPMDFDQLVDRFDLADAPEQQEGLRRRLAAMLRDAQLIRNRKGGFVPVDEADLIVGRISAHPDGFGFLIADAGGDDIYLNGKQMRRVLHGDKAVVCITGEDRRGRREGRIVDVTERANHQIVGRLIEERGIYIIAPDNRRIHQDLMIPENARGGAQGGDMVIADIVEQPTNRHPPVGKITTVLGQHLRPGMETDVALASHDIPHQWPPDIDAALSRFSGTVSDADLDGRKDIRQLPLVTIDGEDARDFDDAVYCEAREDGWRLYVAIADVSHYVQSDEPLDREAFRRGTSVYFPNRVIPMLPEVLSNGLCSLNPSVDRLCMLCEMTLDKTGAIKRSRFHRAVMHSQARLTYTQVAAMLVDKDKALRKQYKTVLPHLQQLHRLFKTLLKSRKRRGAIEFESNETRIVFNALQKIEEIVPVQRNDAHKMIEECMILANVAAARYLERRRLPALYRVHAHPTADKLEELRAFLSLHGLSLSGGDKPAATDYAKLSRQVIKRPDAAVISTVMLRSMQQAVYQPRNEGHFGLALAEYAHFTSPIRRYPDLLVHRAIAFSLQGGKATDYRYDNDAMVGLGEQCSITERRAEEATRDVTSWLKCEYMQDHVGDQFAGVVSAVTSFGLFVQLSNIHVEGLIHITNLGSDYFKFNQTAHTLVGEHTGARYGLGDAIEVIVAAVNLEERKIDFQPVEKSTKRKSKPKKTTPKHVKRKAKKTASAADASKQKNAEGKKRKKNTKRKPRKKTTTAKTTRKKSSGSKSTADKSSKRSRTKSTKKKAATQSASGQRSAGKQRQRG